MRLQLHHFLLPGTLLTSLALSPCAMQAQQPAPAPQPAPAAPVAPAAPAAGKARVHNASYNAGMQAMNDSRWSEAVDDFDKSAKSSPADLQASLYWKAYSLAKLGKKDDARAICNQMPADASDRRSSSWQRQCELLQVETNLDAKSLQALAARLDAMDSRPVQVRVYSKADGYDWDWGPKDYKLDADEEMRLIALSSVYRQDPTRGLELLRKNIFDKSKKIEYRRRCLTILALDKSPDGMQLLLEAARDKEAPELQSIAVQSLFLKGKAVAPELKSIYAAAATNQVKRSVMSMLYAMGSASDLVELARSEKDIEMKREIVSDLALMKDPAATAYMEELLK